MVAPYSGAMFAIVARSGTVSAAVPAPKNSTNLPTTFALRSISVIVNTRSVAVTPSPSCPMQVHAHHIRRQQVDGLAEHAGFRLDAADAPADHADAVDHRRVRVGSDQRVGIVDTILLVHAARKILEVDLVHDADPRAERP